MKGADGDGFELAIGQVPPDLYRYQQELSSVVT